MSSSSTSTAAAPAATESDATTTATASPMSFAIRHKNGVRAYQGPSSTATNELTTVLDLEGANFAEIKYSRNGAIFGVVDADKGVQLYDAVTYAPLKLLARPNVTAIAFSPLNGFVLTWERFNKDTNADKDNLLIWSVQSGEIVCKFTQKSFVKANWPTVLWSDDESLAARMVSSELQFFAGNQFQTIISRIKLGDVTQFSFAPGGSADNQVVATFSPEKKGSAAITRLFRYPDCDTVINTKAFFNATDVTFQWNARGAHLLLTSHTDVDSSGKSYYGIDRLYILSADGSLSETVELKAEGSIHAVAWQADGKSFAVVYGKMPASTTFYSLRAKAVADLGQGSNNTLAYAPNGKVLMVGGFGNLQGEMAFWEPQKLKMYGRGTAYCSSVQSWSPNSRFLLTAVLSPRIRVDNGFKIFTYAGKVVAEIPFADLYDAMWRPAPPGAFASQRLSAPLIDPADVAKLNAATVAAAAPVKAGAYVPPALRNRQGGAPAVSAITAQMRAGQSTAVKRHAVQHTGPVGSNQLDEIQEAARLAEIAKKKANPPKQKQAAKKAEPAFVIEDPEF